MAAEAETSPAHARVRRSATFRAMGSTHSPEGVSVCSAGSVGRAFAAIADVSQPPRTSINATSAITHLLLITATFGMASLGSSVLNNTAAVP